MSKECRNCDWKRSIRHYHVCMNPINDHLFDYFNASSGTVMPDIRIASRIQDDSTCDYFKPLRKKEVNQLTKETK